MKEKDPKYYHMSEHISRMGGEANPCSKATEARTTLTPLQIHRVTIFHQKFLVDYFQELNITLRVHMALTVLRYDAFVYGYTQ